MSKAVLVAGFAALTAFPVGASAQLPGDYPNRPVRFVIPFAPGGAGDFVGRIVALRLGEVLGQPAIVDNRPGASGYLGVELTAASKADGYTVMLGNNGAVVISPAIYTSSPVRPTRDLTSVSLIVDVPSVLVVHPSLPVKTVRELIELARKYPGKLNFGSPGSASGNRLEMEVFRRAAGVDMIHIPYKGGAGPAVTALVSGETQLMFTTLSSVVSFVKSGRLRALAVTAPSRLPARSLGYRPAVRGSRRRRERTGRPASPRAGSSR